MIDAVRAEHSAGLGRNETGRWATGSKSVRQRLRRRVAELQSRCAGRLRHSLLVLRQFGFVVVRQAPGFGQAPDLAPVTQLLDVSVNPGAAYYFV